MEELISIIAKGLVEDKDAVTVTVGPATEDRTVVYHLHVGPQDMGRVIGKQAGSPRRSAPLCGRRRVRRERSRSSRLTDRRRACAGRSKRDAVRRFAENAFRSAAFF